MDNLRNTCCLATVLAILFSSASASPIVIAGSELKAPPAFWEDSYYPLGSTIDRAFPFTVTPVGPYFLEELQIAAFHFQGFAGKSASFSLHEDSQGVPGIELTVFRTQNISTAAQVHTLTPSKDAILYADTLYWIVGETQRGFPNWNLGDSTFGQTAYRRPNSDWIVQDNRNVAAYALLGTPIPEPSSMILVGFMALGVVCFRKRRHQTLR